MPRRASPGVRQIENDPLYGSKLVQQVINKVMAAGKKPTPRRIVPAALENEAGIVGAAVLVAAENPVE
mgnify:CR=1 FL=1